MSTFIQLLDRYKLQVVCLLIVWSDWFCYDIYIPQLLVQTAASPELVALPYVTGWHSVALLVVTRWHCGTAVCYWVALLYFVWEMLSSLIFISNVVLNEFWMPDGELVLCTCWDVPVWEISYHISDTLTYSLTSHQSTYCHCFINSTLLHLPFVFLIFFFFWFYLWISFSIKNFYSQN